MPCIPLIILALTTAADVEPQTMRLLDFQDAARVAEWRPVHDGVMGGVSSGSVRPGDGAAHFEGELSLENNGGFASFRILARLPDLSQQDGLRLRVRGDGQVYKLSLRTDGAWDGVGWQAPFEAVADQWTTVDLAFEDLVPTWHGRLVGAAAPFDASRIRQIGILIADKQAGPYTLDVASIDAWSAGPRPRESDGTPASVRSRTADLASALDDGVQARMLVPAMTGRERLLVVAAPGDLDAMASRQIGRLIASGGELATRDLRIVSLMGTQGGRLAGRTLSPVQVVDLRELWDLPPRDWAVALVGKDGEVKQRWSSPVSPEHVFTLIDAMPMRQRELRERSTR
ncbi:MAG: CIA30 family protein [Planctomycetota bacterium]|jgi:monofunctional biosynthetic peptidoglycan transglycosylase